MSSRYLDMVRSQRRSGWQWTGRRILSAIGLVGIVASAIFWARIQLVLSHNDYLIAGATTVGLVLAPPALWSFLLPFTPGGMLLQKVHARTYGYVAVVAMALYYGYYSFQLLWSWWAAQPVVAESGLVYQQVILCLILFTGLPALTWSAVDSEELVQQLQQAHIVKRYELQTQADIAILRATLLRAQEKALLGFANLTIDEREELAGVMRGLVTSIDTTLHEIGHSVKTVSGATIHFDSLEGNEDIRDVLDYISDTLVTSALTVPDDDQDGSIQDAPPQRRARGVAPRAGASRSAHASAPGDTRQARRTARWSK